jgi:hypothetical protein
MVRFSSESRYISWSRIIFQFHSRLPIHSQHKIFNGIERDEWFVLFRIQTWHNSYIWENGECISIPLFALFPCSNNWVGNDFNVWLVCFISNGIFSGFVLESYCFEGILKLRKWDRIVIGRIKKRKRVRVWRGSESWNYRK